MRPGAEEQTHMDHGLLVGDLPPGLLRVVVDPDDGVVIGRVRVAATRSFGRVIFRVLFDRRFLRFEHGIELGQHAGCPRSSRRFAVKNAETSVLPYRMV